MTIRTASQGILADENPEKREEIIELLTKAYWMELETVMSYIANSVNPDGLRAQEIVESLQKDIQEELGHAQQFAARIKELYGVVPGSLEFSAEQSYLQPPDHQTDIVHVIKGVIEAETGAIEHYNRIIEVDRRRRLRHAGHGDRDPARRGRPPPPLRGLPARVRGRRAGVARRPPRTSYAAVSRTNSSRERSPVRLDQDRALAADVGLLAVMHDVEPDRFVALARPQRDDEPHELQQDERPEERVQRRNKRGKRLVAEQRRIAVEAGPRRGRRSSSACATKPMNRMPVKPATPCAASTSSVSSTRVRGRQHDHGVARQCDDYAERDRPARPDVAAGRRDPDAADDDRGSRADGRHLPPSDQVEHEPGQRGTLPASAACS